MNKVFLSGDEEIVFTNDLLGIPDKHPYTMQLTLLKLVRLLFEVRDWVYVDPSTYDYLRNSVAMYRRGRASYTERRSAQYSGIFNIIELFNSLGAELVLGTSVDRDGSTSYRARIDQYGKISGMKATQMWVDDIWTTNMEKF
ncbi:hypothetical protein C121_40 [Stenotrophomonas phage C121]|uniref:hypothetical protein n=1 Tax=Stenotrophomonas phage C121 TaxID=2914029 RepID=UPI00232973B5|nr:hypothetical protein PP752_gp40 [Stenotrophomonas phage C121]UKL14773.1 hypothetical protein C121_40 [Stenotrophomonas phage C121]